MKKTLCALLAALMLSSLLPAGAAAAGAPVLALTHVPAYGENAAFAGVVFMEDGGAFAAEDYRISLYLQLSEGDTYWVKPTYAKPYAEVDADGTFSIAYATGGNDRQAQIIHIMLIPANFTPGSSFAEAKAKALDYVKVTRTADGGVAVSPQREAPAANIARKASGLTVSAEKLAVNVGLYTEGAPGGGLNVELICKQLDAVADFADIVRFYGAAGELYPAYGIAHTLGLKVVGTAWLGRDKAANQKELDALIEHCNKGYVSVACVGSETLLRGDLTSDELIADIEYVRSHLTDQTIPVTTADDAGKLLEHRAVRAACDLLMPNSYPYWEGVELSKAAASFTSTIAAIQAVSACKEIIVSETGWPTAGGAATGEAAAGQYFSAIRDWSLASHTLMLWFDAADEPWKTADEGAAGAHWGLMDTGLTLKNGFAETDFFRAANAKLGLNNFTKKNVYNGGMFRDVTDGVWYEKNVAAAYEYSLMNGKGGSTFDPLGEITLAEVVAIACRLHDTYHARNVSYLSGNKWYDGYVQYALAAGILHDGQFSDYERPAKRAEVAEILASALPDKALAARKTVDSIPDVTGAERYGAAVYRLYCAGVVGGVDTAGNYAPARTITRAEVAAIATRMADPALRV